MILKELFLKVVYAFQIQVIGSKMEEVKDLKVNILLDANRGSRGSENSRTMLLPLVKHEDQCKVYYLFALILIKI